MSTGDAPHPGPAPVRTTALATVGGGEGLIFDVDGAQYLPTGEPCTVCGVHQGIEHPPRALVRIRRKAGGRSTEVAFLCPDCVGRAMIQINRCNLLGQMSPAVRAALRRMINAKLPAKDVRRG
jgi:hypothetical protein